MPRLNGAVVMAGVAVAATVACARMGPPPGGPPDASAPVLVGTLPESVMVLPGFDGWVTFSFDEVIDEGGTPSFGRGNSSLEQLVRISPDSGVPRVRWRRDRLLVQPRSGWRPDVVYRVELLPGLRDLRGNRSEERSVVTFTTGAPVPTHALSGDAVDWMSGRFVPRALVEAMLVADSSVYRTTTDSSGAFAMAPLPQGEYLVAVIRDENANGRRDLRDPWDTVRVAAGSPLVGEVWVFPRDTAPPRLIQNGVAVYDSFSVALAFNVPLDTTLSLGPDAIRIMRLPDSVNVPGITGLPPARHDSIYRPIDAARRAAAARAADTTAADSAAVPAVPPPQRQPDADADARPDTTRRPRQQRPAIDNRLVMRTQGYFEQGYSYRVIVYGIRSLTGVTADSVMTVLVMPPRPPARDTTAAASRDSSAAPPSTPPVSRPR